MAKVELREIINQIVNLPQTLREARELKGVMRRNSRVKPTEVVVTEKVKPRRQMPAWAVAMRLAAEEKNPPHVQISKEHQTDEVPSAIVGIVRRSNNSRKATEGMARYAHRGVQKRTEEALMSHQLDQMFENGVQTGDEVFK